MTMTPEESKKAQAEKALMSPEQRNAEQAAHENAITQSKTQLDKIKAYAAMDEVQKRFVTLLGDKVGRAYVESVVIAVANNEDLQRCSASSIMISAMRAASLHLSVDPLLHQAHLVPMGKDAMLILDYRGLQQLSINTGYYEIAPFVAEGRLVRVLAEWLPHFPGFHLYYPSRRQQRPVLTAFIHALRHRDTTPAAPFN